MLTKIEKDLYNHFHLGVAKVAPTVRVTAHLDAEAYFTEDSGPIENYPLLDHDGQEVIEYDFSNAFWDYYITKDGEPLISVTLETLGGELKRLIAALKRDKDFTDAGFKLEMELPTSDDSLNAITEISYIETDGHLILPRKDVAGFNVFKGRNFTGKINEFVFTAPTGDSIAINGDQQGQLRNLLKMQYSLLNNFVAPELEGGQLDFQRELPPLAPKDWSLRFNKFNEPVCHVSSDDHWIAVEKGSSLQIHNLMSDQLGDSRFEYLTTEEGREVKNRINGQFPSEGSENFDKIMFEVVKEFNPHKKLEHPIRQFVSFGNEDEVVIYETEHYIIWNVL